MQRFYLAVSYNINKKRRAPVPFDDRTSGSQIKSSRSFPADVQKATVHVAAEAAERSFKSALEIGWATTVLGVL